MTRRNGIAAQTLALAISIRDRWLMSIAISLGESVIVSKRSMQ
jgi:hypothetical protein